MKRLRTWFRIAGVAVVLAVLPACGSGARSTHRYTARQVQNAFAAQGITLIQVRAKSCVPAGYVCFRRSGKPPGHSIFLVYVRSSGAHLTLAQLGSGFGGLPSGSISIERGNVLVVAPGRDRGTIKTALSRLR